MNPYSEYIKMKNTIVEDWYNTGFISLDERNELYISTQEIEEPNDFMDIPDPMTSNEKSYSLYNRGSDFLSNPYFKINNTFFNIKSNDGRYYIKSSNGVIDLIEETYMKDNDETTTETEWNIIKDNTNFIRLVNKFGSYLDVNRDKNIVVKKLTVGETDIKSDSNLWKMKSVDKDNTKTSAKYYLESVFFPGFRLEFANKLILNSGISDKNICVFTPVEENIKTRYGKSSILLELEKQLEKYGDDIIANKNFADILKTLEPIQPTQGYINNLNEYINKITPSNIEVNKNAFGLNGIIKGYLERKSSELRTKEYRNSKFLSQFKTDKKKYDNSKEKLTNINNKTTTLEDNIYILNENYSYNSLKLKALYFIRASFMIITFIFVISICKNVYKMII
jgi:hypothetical protein